MNGAAYEHTQVGKAILIPLGLVVVAILTMTSMPWILLPVLGAVAVLFGTMTVSISGRELVCRFGIGLIRKRFSIEEIREAETIRVPWYMGYGIRLTPYGWLYRVSGWEAIQITMHGGKRYGIGTDEPEKLLRALERAGVPRAAL